MAVGGGGATVMNPPLDIASSFHMMTRLKEITQRLAPPAWRRGESKPDGSVRSLLRRQQATDDCHFINRYTFISAMRPPRAGEAKCMFGLRELPGVHGYRGCVGEKIKPINAGAEPNAECLGALVAWDLRTGGPVSASNPRSIMCMGCKVYEAQCAMLAGMQCGQPQYVKSGELNMFLDSVRIICSDSPTADPEVVFPPALGWNAPSINPVSHFGGVVYGPMYVSPRAHPPLQTTTRTHL